MLINNVFSSHPRNRLNHFRSHFRTGLARVRLFSHSVLDCVKTARHADFSILAARSLLPVFDVRSAASILKSAELSRPTRSAVFAPLVQTL